jgi:hypothetical protein
VWRILYMHTAVMRRKLDSNKLFCKGRELPAAEATCYKPNRLVQHVPTSRQELQPPKLAQTEDVLPKCICLAYLDKTNQPFQPSACKQLG